MSLLQAVERHLPSGYTIREQLGAGATSWVYLARKDEHGPALAVKVLQPGLTRDISTNRFLREMQILRTLDHPRIIPLLEPGEADGALFFTMPYVPGETLRARLDAQQKLPLREALAVARDVAEALGHAHGRGVVHRDVKPDNILLADGRAYLMDFGFASAPSLTPPKAAAQDARLAIGTPDYMSPEQVMGKRAEDWRGDFFSLACVLQEMLCGRPPFSGGSPRAVMERRTTDAPEDLRTLCPDVPIEVVTLVRRNLSISPNDRFATAGMLHMALAAALERLDEQTAVA